MLESPSWGWRRVEGPTKELNRVERSWRGKVIEFLRVAGFEKQKPKPEFRADEYREKATGHREQGIPQESNDLANLIPNIHQRERNPYVTSNERHVQEYSLNSIRQSPQWQPPKCLLIDERINKSW